MVGHHGPRPAARIKSALRVLAWVPRALDHPVQGHVFDRNQLPHPEYVLSALEEFDKGRRDRRRIDIVLLTGEGLTPSVRTRGGHRSRAVAEPGRLPTVNHQGRDLHAFDRLAWGRVVAHDGGVVDGR